MRLECKNEKLKAKNGFFLSWPNMALLNPCFKDQIDLILEKKEPVERERGEQRRREEEEEEEEEEGGEIKAKKVWMLGF